eukprot:gene13386-15813_t
MAGFTVPNSMKEIYDSGCDKHASTSGTDTHPFPCGKIGPHLLTGPIFVEGAEVGDVLQVEVLHVGVWTDWGWNSVRPGFGSLKYFDGGLETLGLDLEKQTIQMPWGGEIPWNITGTGPFFGQLGTAPPPDLGKVSSVAPGASYGGNIDNKQLGQGATLYLPVNVPGALFSAGDGHAVQGDGEVCVTALETSLVGDFRLTVRKDLGLKGQAHGTSWIPAGEARPTQIRAEIPTHFMTMAFHEDLDVAEVLALEDMLSWMQLVSGLEKEQLYRLCSLAADMHVTQVVNQQKGIHFMLPKAALETNKA